MERYEEIQWLRLEGAYFEVKKALYSGSMRRRILEHHEKHNGSQSMYHCGIHQKLKTNGEYEGKSQKVCPLVQSDCSSLR